MVTILFRHKRISGVFFGSLVLLTMLTSCSYVSTATPKLNLMVTPETVRTSGKVTLISNFDFNATPSFGPIPKELVDLSNTQAFFDFDRAKITNDQGADIYLYDGCGTACFNLVITVNGATTVLQRTNQSEPGYLGCLKFLQDEKMSDGLDPVPGHYSCLNTSEGNIVQILAIENVPAWKNSKFVFQYQLWYPNKMH